MGEIIKFIIDNFNRLKPFDYVLILLVAFLLSFMAFLVLRWIYTTYIKAQSDLLEIKEKTISTYKEKAEKLEGDMRSFEAQMQIAKADLNFYATVTGGEAISKERFINLYKNAMDLRGAIFDARVVQSMQQMIEVAKSLLVVYALNNVEDKFSDAPKSIWLLKQLDELEAETSESLKKIQEFDIKKPEDLFLAYPPHYLKEGRVIDPIQERINNLHGQISLYLNKSFNSKAAKS